MRLDKFLANFNIGTRKEVKKIIKAGEVAVNGVICKVTDFNINEEQDTVIFQEKELVYQNFYYFMLNKPQDVISATFSYNKKEKTVLDFLPKHLQKKNIFPAGRLDKDTEGLILLTNDGLLAHNLLNPKKHIFKKYYAEVDSFLNDEAISAFSKGVYIQEDDYTALPAKLEIISRTQDKSSCYVWLQEGKYHQVKRMLRAVGNECVYLKRLSMGSLILDPTLKLGDYRELTPAEITDLQKSNLE